MSASVNVAIVGAGPYGLSIAAHLRGQGIDHRIFGEPMQMWRDHMPPGMFLKSDGKASDLAAPEGDFTLEQFCAARKLEFDRARVPVKRETFIEYGMAFQRRFAPRTERKRLVQLHRTSDGFDLRFDDGEVVTANHVALAVGILAFRTVPDVFGKLPQEVVSHSSDFGTVERLDGRDVVIVGAGSSALDLAALLYQRGANVTIVTRGRRLAFHGVPPAQRSILWKIRAPDSKIGAGWVHRICDDAPQIVHALPYGLRHHMVQTMLGPAGGYFIKDQVIGKAVVKYERGVTAARTRGARVQLETTGQDGQAETVEGDHVILATGYKLDVSRLEFLMPGIRTALAVKDGAPVLSRNFESSVPGLYFAGGLAAPSFGPVLRFVAGAPHPAKRLANHLAARTRPSLNVSLVDAVG